MTREILGLSEGSSSYYTRLRNRVEGPFSVEDLHRRARRKQFSRLYQVSTDRRSWKPASEFPELFPRPPKRDRPVRSRAAAQAVELSEERPSAQPEQPQTYEPAPQAMPVEAPAQPEPSSAWWYVFHDREAGPVSFEELKSFIAEGHITAETLVWSDGMPNWLPAGEELPDLFAVAEEAPVFFDSVGDGSYEGQEPVQTSAMAVASLALAITVVGAILAIVFGHVALSQIRHSQRTYQPLGGRGMALAGVIIGYAVIAIASIAGIVFLIVRLVQENGGS